MTKCYVGLMSGTSMDGIDAVLAAFDNAEVHVLATHSIPYPEKLKAELRSAIRQPLNTELDPSGRLHREVGEQFLKAAIAVIEAGAVDKEDILAIGSHGQTLRHQPDVAQPFSLQIGDADVIAQGAGIKTVANFRAADIAAGGQGAPLVPPFHEWLLASDVDTRVILNIGGIANVTVLPANSQPITGFDTGPGNGLMDAWILEQRNRPFDSDGAWAATGEVVASLLARMLTDPYFEAKVPKSTGFEHFNLEWLRRHDVDQHAANDVQATLCELSAATIAQQIGERAAAVDAIFVCGGGTHNKELMRRLMQRIPETPIQTTAAVGLDPDWVEAVAFAWLAMKTLRGEYGNMPSVTGASHAVVLGDIHSP